MTGFSADTHELHQLGHELHQLADAWGELEPVNAQAGRAVVDAARPPRRSGALAASLRADATRNGVAFASTARYWTFVHWGAPRRHIKARPWFVEAVETSRDQLAAIYAEHVTDTIREVHP